MSSLSFVVCSMPNKLLEQGGCFEPFAYIELLNQNWLSWAAVRHRNFPCAHSSSSNGTDPIKTEKE